MATYRDLLDAIARVGAATGAPDAWKNGLTGADVAVACTPFSPPRAVDAVLARLTAAHPAVFGRTNPSEPPPAAGATADAIRGAESLLARQHSDAAHLDLQVLTAVAAAHATARGGLATLSKLQRDVEAAVASRTDLDTPAGARELQRFLIGKMRDIRAVLEEAGLDAGSKAALAEALVALYASSTPDVPARTVEPENPRGATPLGRERGAPEARAADPVPLTTLDDGADSLPDYLAYPWLDQSLLPASVPATAAAPPAPLPVATAPSAAPFGGMPSAAPFSGGLPAAPFGGAPGMAGTSWPDLSPAGLTPADLFNRHSAANDDPSPLPDIPDSPDEAATDTAATDPAATATAATDAVAADAVAEDAPSAETPEEPTPVRLPDGQTVVAPTAELASVITAAVAGTPIPTAFTWQGITIPPPGSPVAAPVDPTKLVAGDIAVLADRHALALGNGQVLLDNQIQPISSVTGPGFVGWQHPPEPDPMKTPPDVPAPDRSAATAPS